MLHKNRFFVLVSSFAVAVLLLGGCAAPGKLNIRHGILVTSNVSRLLQHRYKGRAFVIGKISTHLLTTPWPPYWPYSRSDLTPCLPAWTYEKALRYDLQKVWRVKHLAYGTHPSIPVDLVIRVEAFIHGLGLHDSPAMVVDVHVKGNTVRLLAMNGGDSILTPGWMLSRYLIPIITQEVVYTVSAFKDGNEENLLKAHKAIGPTWFGWYFESAKKNGISLPMSQSTMERATGLTADQLSKMCSDGGG